MSVFGLGLSHTEVGRLMHRVAGEVRDELYGPDAVVEAATHAAQNAPEILSVQPDGSRYRSNEADAPRRTPEMPPEDRGWRENKVAVVSRLERGCVDGEGTWHPPREVVKTYVATTKDVRAFGQQLRTETERRGIKKAVDVVAVCDNGHGNPEMLKREYPDIDVRRISDFFHASGRIGEVVSIIGATKGAKKRRRQFESLKAMLWDGKTKPLCKKLRAFASKVAREPATLTALDSRPEARALWEHALYFERNAGSMDYPTYRERGWPIASSTVESTCSRFGDRVKHARMRWTRTGADAVHVLKAAVMSQDQRWVGRWPGSIPVLEWRREGEAN